MEATGAEGAREIFPREEEAAPGGIRGSRVLLVEDEADLLEILTDLLEAEGCEVRGERDGAAALAAALADPPDAILCDVVLPGIDGYEFCRRLRSASAGRDVPLLFLTARGEPEDRRRGYEAGANRYLPKPISAEEILEALERAIAEGRAARGARRREEPPSGGGEGRGGGRP